MYMHGALFSISFIHIIELQRTTAVYEEKQRGGATVEKVMFSLIWNVEELKHLNSDGRRLRTEILTALDILNQSIIFLGNCVQFAPGCRMLLSVCIDLSGLLCS